ncbi:PKD-like family lipoprotein [Pinibacter aurantiacus]|uniref:PKD-like family protein n=1 Tax=Pinibacter aurantiacus TaxID=2851599 RepID=A0A9E2SCD2_9BACT|nr:PKD-like family lipoprotein [Pinibacter aurantiacus]MBV4358914.1 hypothetical protein [Pinibacter aurantiacus]
MKKISLYILLFISVLAVSCLKDRSNYNIHTPNPIVIDTTGVPGSYVVFQMDTLRISPAISKEGLNPDNLTYSWTMNYFQGYKRVIGTQKKLEGVVTEAPNSSAYSLILTVTDTTTNLKAFFSWIVTVNPRFGEGLVVADTKDGVNTDLNLIMAYNFTSNILYDSISRVYKNLYSAANGAPLPGIVKGVAYMNYQNNRVLTCITDNTITRINPISYIYTKMGNDNFILPPAAISPNMVQSVAVNNAHEYLVNNGKVHSRYGTNFQYGYAFLFDKTDYVCQKMCGLQTASTNGGAVYDEKNNRFLLLPTITSNSAPLAAYPVFDNSNPAPAFDPSNMGNKTCLNMEEGYNQKVFAVMKTRDLDQYAVYQLSVLSPVNGKMGYAVNDISSNPEIGQSKFYTESTQENVLFYATDTKVYSTTLLTGGGTSPLLRYTVANGEKITGMKMHIKGGRMSLPSLTAPDDYTQRITATSANRLLLLSTYNESTKEGKIIAIPLQTLGVGGLVTDPAYIKTYGGFGKITAFNFQAP